MAESRSVVKLCGVAGIALLALTSGALAGGSLKDEPAPEREFAYSFTLTGTSDYVFRGISQSDNDPTVQASAGFTYGIFYAGLWGSGVDWIDSYSTDEDIEIDYYAGIKPTWGIATFDLGVIYYTYPGVDDSEILELKFGVSAEVAKGLTLGGTYYYSPDYNDLDYGVYEFSAGYALPKVWIFDASVTGQYGYVDNYSGSGDYGYWNAGLALTVDKLTFDLRYWDNDLDAGECGPYQASTCDSRFVFSTTIALP